MGFLIDSVEWGWDCPFCGGGEADTNYIVIRIKVDHHLAHHEQEAVSAMEAMLRAR